LFLVQKEKKSRCKVKLKFKLISIALLLDTKQFSTCIYRSNIYI